VGTRLPIPIVIRPDKPRLLMSFVLWPWLTLVLLGAWHGLNPAMGWLFAVALGLQQRSRRAVFRAMIPIAIGHALAIGLVVFVVLTLGAALPVEWLQLGGAAILLGLGGWRLWRTRHPTWVGMRVGFWDLTSWSWIMASAHGAGMMLVPLLLGATCGQTVTGKGRLLFSSSPLAVGAVLVHTVSHLVVAAMIAWLVYDWIGLAVLRRSWFNVDLIWSFSLLMGGGLLLFMMASPVGR
jgi:hypothetical protein